MKYLLLLIAIFSYFCLSTSQTTICDTHLDCLKSACCIDGKCQVADVCKQKMDDVYIIIGLIGFGFIIGGFFYFLIILRSTAKNVKELKERFLLNSRGEMK